MTYGGFKKEEWSMTQSTTLRGADGRVVGTISRDSLAGIRTARKVTGQVIGSESRNITWRVDRRAVLLRRWVRGLTLRAPSRLASYEPILVPSERCVKFANSGSEG